MGTPICLQNVNYLFRRTPIEQYGVLGRKVFVKRDDLFGVYPAPPLGKLRGLETLLKSYHQEGIRAVGCWDTRVSKLGQGLAVLVQNFSDMRAVISYPCRKGHPVPNAIQIAEALGAEVIPIRGNHVGICYSQATKLVRKLRGKMLPFGLDCPEAVLAIAEEAATVQTDLVRGGTVIICSGSGVTLAGLLIGLPVLPQRLIAISSGRSTGKILACVSQYVPKIPNTLEVRAATFPYDYALEFPCPFPSHPHYDLKAWKYLVDHIRLLPDPIFFWNVGA
jgi:1-aminocyclopropane-1-carboxylate deaminase/D-cysteine desulfhydrase-like pyridoxal-dependent ACC family enzyme